MQGHQGQGEGEDNFGGVWIREQEFVVGHRPVKLSSGKGCRNGNMVALVKDSSLFPHDFDDHLVWCKLRAEFTKDVGIEDFSGLGYGDVRLSELDLTQLADPAVFRCFALQDGQR